MSARETALAGLASVVTAALVVAPPSATPPLLREEPLGQRIPPQGAVWLFDGAAVEETVILSPYMVHVTHEAQLVVMAPGATPGARTALMDALLSKIGAAIAADRTLGGAAEWAGAGSASFEDVEWEGAAPARSATVPVTLVFTAAGSALA